MKKKVAKKAAANKAGFVIGEIYLLQTVTLYFTGRLVAVNALELIIEDAAWIADTGRFSDALKTLSFSEVEPFPDGPVIVGRGALICACQINEVQRIKK